MTATALAAVPITAMYAGVLGLLAVFLANQVLYARLRTGSVPQWKPDTVLRVQANFVENVPLALALLLILELQQKYLWSIYSMLFQLLIIQLPWVNNAVPAIPPPSNCSFSASFSSE